jgi:hypothetical protein
MIVLNDMLFLTTEIELSMSHGGKSLGANYINMNYSTDKL